MYYNVLASVPAKYFLLSTETTEIYLILLMQTKILALLLG